MNGFYQTLKVAYFKWIRPFLFGKIIVNKRKAGEELIETNSTRYCENCKKETLHTITEDALEINYLCINCKRDENLIKTFF
ncbi:hypothetical protein [Bacillus sp. V2I10]|uniref:hypothetical protein n=1 Tax=Bacillus sp. V2I10 TaxID=3042276 RepID=UPI0027851B35|nr:hypothetical protein [Bacillus sp. V2I10]MDQ0860811.1 hypothetical protein [Bacillus sp. V2I10]